MSNGLDILDPSALAKAAGLPTRPSRSRARELTSRGSETRGTGCYFADALAYGARSAERDLPAVHRAVRPVHDVIDGEVAQ
jgi:hypothetical protein